MTGNLFDNAKFGDMFLTTENKQAVFLRFAENAEYKFAILYVEDWGMVQVFRHNGKEINNDAAHSIISKQEESVSDRFAFKAIPRLLEMIEPTDRAKAYIAKLANTLEVEGYHTDAKIVRESLKRMNGEKVPMATMDGKPVSEDFEKALANEWKDYIDRGAATVDALEDNTQELAFAKGFYRGAKWKEQKDSIISEDFEEAAIEAFKQIVDSDKNSFLEIFKAGTKWKEQQIMAKAVDGEIGYWNLRGLSVNMDLPSTVEEGDEVKIILIKREEI